MFVSVSMFPGGKKLFKRLVFGLLSVFLSIGLLNSVFNVRTIEGARTGTYYIRADSCPNPFRLVNVTLVAKDVNGVPIKNALVKAFSEDWGFRVPNFQFNQTDENGCLTLSLPTGNWSFFIWGGWDFVNRNPGQGLFLVLRNVTISSDTYLVMQPDSYMSILFLGLDGRPLEGEIRILDSDHTPIIPSPTAGRTDKDGKINLYVKGGLQYNILFSCQNSTVAYIFLLEKIENGRSILIQPTLSSLAQITFNVFDRNNMPCNAWFFINYDSFNVGENTGLAPINIRVNGKLDLYTTPALVTITPWITIDSWCYRFTPLDYQLRAGEKRELRVGGPLSIKLWVQREQTQTWIDIRDSYGNIVGLFWDDGLPTQIPITLTKGDKIIYEGVIDSLFDCVGSTYDVDDSPNYTIYLDMGPYGAYNLTGTLLAQSTLLPTKLIHTEHLDVEAPDVGGQVEERFNIMAKLMEEIYQAESSALEANLSSRTQVKFQIDVIAGVAGSNFVGMGIGFSLDSSYVTIPSTFISVASHELGHVFQLSPPYSPPGYYIENWFGEPYATLIGNAAIEKIFGAQLALFDRGCHDRFYYYLKTGRLNGIGDLIENIQFALYFVRNKYNLSAFKRFNQIWTGNTSKINILQSKGLTLNETVVATLSFASNDNLSWIFSSAGLKIRRDKVSWGLTLLSDVTPPTTTYVYDCLWHNTDFTITLTAADYESGVSEIYYRVNNGLVKAVGVDGQPLISTEGADNTLEYWSVDNAGNEESPHKILTGIKLDKTKPLIVEVRHQPEDNVEPNQKVKVLVNATDLLSGIRNITLSYNINTSTIWIDLPMTFNSTTGLYEATIQVQRANVLVKYKVTACDNAGNIKVEDKCGQYYTYTVIPEFSSTLILATLILITIITVILLKPKRRSQLR